MSSREKRYNALLDRAKALVAAGKTETFADLAVWLNSQGITTGYGTPYVGTRGTARLCHCGWDYWAKERGLGVSGADPIAQAFTNAWGGYAYN
jgi:hypothetical protein